MEAEVGNWIRTLTSTSSLTHLTRALVAGFFSSHMIAASIAASIASLCPQHRSTDTTHPFLSGPHNRCRRRPPLLLGPSGPAPGWPPHQGGPANLRLIHRS